MGSKSKKELFWEVFTVLVIIGILCVLLIPDVQQASSGGARERFRDQIRRIGAAFAHYHDEHACRPPAALTDSDGNPTHNWRALILPQMERYFESKDRRVYYLFEDPWNSKQNSAVAALNPDLYHREIRLGQESANITTKLVAIIDDSTLWGKDHLNPHPRFVKDEEKKILLIEIPNPGGLWNEPTDISLADLATLIQSSAFESRGTHALYNNGEVIWLSPEEIASPDFLKRITVTKKRI